MHSSTKGIRRDLITLQSIFVTVYSNPLFFCFDFPLIHDQKIAQKFVQKIQNTFFAYGLPILRTEFFSKISEVTNFNQEAEVLDGTGNKLLEIISESPKNDVKDVLFTKVEPTVSNVKTEEEKKVLIEEIE